ncbi:MAG: helix-turn-helix domain-containing protein, partial [Bacilli bacterium]|nr:helix-turn-helix domain-containing protein [Bacilli bacterium]
KALSEIVAENLAALRKKVGLTQQELADRLAYSDKTVSKWELGRAIPSVDVLKELADFYGVTVDYLITENADINVNVDNRKEKIQKYNHIIVLSLVATIIYLIATITFVWTLFREKFAPWWQVFIWATAVASFAIAAIMRRWFKGNRIAWLILASVFVWSLLAAFYCQFIDQNIWYIFIIGAPVEILLGFLTMMRKV